jgi:hypothetical protein
LNAQERRSKIINVVPIFNQYCGINTEPLADERYLVEWTWPKVKVSFKSAVHEQQLDERDLEYLVRSGFYNWMTYLLSKYFRAEVGIDRRLSLEMLFENDSKRRQREQAQLDQRMLQSEFELQDQLTRTDLKGMHAKPKADETASPELKKAQKQVADWFE